MRYLIVAAMVLLSVVPASAQLTGDTDLIARQILEVGETVSPGVRLTAANRLAGAWIKLDATDSVMTDTGLVGNVVIQRSTDGGLNYQTIGAFGFVGGAHYNGGNRPSVGLTDREQPDADYRVRVTLNKRARLGIQLGPPPE